MAQIHDKTSGKKPLPNLSELKKVHIVGVCGTLMGAFASYLKRHGIHVTGSDQNVYPPMSDVLRGAGVEIFEGYRAENITGMREKPDLVVIGNVIRGDNLEARAAVEGGYAYSSLPEAMEKLFLQKTRNLVVAGTHGKTTTSSLMAFTLARCGRDPSYFIGGVTPDLPFSFHIAGIESGNLFVLEGDEYDTAFWDKVPKFNHYLPDDVVLTSVEFDHADIYADFEAVRVAFVGLLARIRKGGRLIACYDYAAIRDLVRDHAKDGRFEVISYGSTAATGATYTPGNARTEGEWTRFEVLENGKRVDEVCMHLAGNHNVMNALSVWIQCDRLGIDRKKSAAAMKEFRGVKRRQEERGEVGGVLVIDDFAHHPTAVRETLKAFRARYPGRRLISVFEPRSATSRRKIFQHEYSEAFREGSVAFIMVPYDQSRIAADDQFSSAELVADLRKQGTEALLMNSVDEGVAQVARFAKAGDVIAVLSNGGFGGFITKLLGALKG